MPSDASSRTILTMLEHCLLLTQQATMLVLAMAGHSSMPFRTHQFLNPILSPLIRLTTQQSQWHRIEAANVYSSQAACECNTTSLQLQWLPDLKALTSTLDLMQLLLHITDGLLVVQFLLPGDSVFYPVPTAGSAMQILLVLVALVICKHPLMFRPKMSTLKA